MSRKIPIKLIKTKRPASVYKFFRFSASLLLKEPFSPLILPPNTYLFVQRNPLREKIPRILAGAAGQEIFYLFDVKFYVKILLIYGILVILKASNLFVDKIWLIFKVSLIYAIDHS
ncbi:MAG: hypothetical protein ACTTJC_03945 [Campylobacter sp.]